ncbi:MAG: PhoH family protein [Acidothermus sp.]|nr:PhoH family protein [Acidothermus sp.]MCL6537718.1 PhoH family protein [Acidothermus sp.]
MPTKAPSGEIDEIPGAAGHRATEARKSSLSEPAENPAVSSNPGVSSQPPRTVVLDTSALMADPEGIFDAYPGADLVVPLAVVQELDGLKKRLDPAGAAAREVLRRIEALRLAAGGDLREPYRRRVGGTVRMQVNGVQATLLRRYGLHADSPDNRIVGTALGLAAGQPDGPSVLVVSNDTALRLTAAAVGLAAAEHIPVDGVPPQARPDGWVALDVPPEVITNLFEEHVVDAAGAGAGDLPENTFVVLRSGTSSALARIRAGVLRVLDPLPPVWGLRAANKEQRFALDLLLDDEVRVVVLDGPAGTGKTLCAVAAGLHMVVEQHRFERMSVYRPVIPVGQADLGYLPGTLDEKIDPWMAAITDAVAALSGDAGERRRRGENSRGKVAQDSLDYIKAQGLLTMESVTHLRGRTLHSTFVLVDEAMNLSPQVGKTLLTRIGADSKIVLTGDTSQIDAPFLSERTNALTAVVSAFAGQPCFGHVRLTRGERSPVAELAARLM